MTEAELDLAALGVTVSDARPASTPPAGDPAGSATSSPDTPKRSAEAEQMDEHIKTAIRKNITNHEMACFIVDVVSPGWAIERMGGAGLERLSPMQHLLIACTAVGGTIFITNPDLARKLVSSLKGGGKSKQEALPETIMPTPHAEQMPTHDTLVEQDPEQVLRDMSGVPL